MKSHRIAGCVFVVLGLFAMPAAACHIVTVYAGPDQVVCVGSTVSVSVSSTTCNSGCTTFSYVWSAPGGSPSSGTGSSFSCYYDATKTGTRTITVTATCAGGASGQASVQVTVVGVGSVTASKTTVYIGENVTFAAVSYPANESMDCLHWEKRWKNAGSSTWGNWQSAGSGNPKTGSSSVPGYLQYRARNGTSYMKTSPIIKVMQAVINFNVEDVLTGGVRSGLDLDTLIITVNGNTIPIPSNPDLTIIEIKDPNDVLVELEIEYRCPYNIRLFGIICG
mgnify:FL=1